MYRVQRNNVKAEIIQVDALGERVVGAMSVDLIGFVLRVTGEDGVELYARRVEEMVDEDVINNWWHLYAI